MAQRQTRFVSDTVSWELWERDAAPVLRPHVRGYLRLPGDHPAWAVPAPGGAVRRGPRHPQLRSGVPGATARVASFVAATHTRHAVVERRHQHGVELRLTPLGAHMLLGVPMDELTCRVVELDAAPRRGGRADRPHLRGGGMGGAVRADGRVARRSSTRPDSAGARARALARLLRSPVAADRAARGGDRLEPAPSRRPLPRAVGLPPKLFGRILRFRHAGRARSPGGPRWRDRARLRLLRPGAPQPRLPRVLRPHADQPWPPGCPTAVSPTRSHPSKTGARRGATLAAMKRSTRPALPRRPGGGRVPPDAFGFERSQRLRRRQRRRPPRRAALRRQHVHVRPRDRDRGGTARAAARQPRSTRSSRRPRRPPRPREGGGRRDRLWAGRPGLRLARVHRPRPRRQHLVVRDLPPE